MVETINAYKIAVRNVEGRDDAEDIGIVGQIILE
jgi:hypothetical protein